MLLYRLLAPQWEIQDLRCHGAPDWTAFARAKVKVRGKGGMACHWGSAEPPMDANDLYRIMICTLCHVFFATHPRLGIFKMFKRRGFKRLYLFSSPNSETKPEDWDGVEPPIGPVIFAM